MLSKTNVFSSSPTCYAGRFFRIQCFKQRMWLRLMFLSQLKSLEYMSMVSHMRTIVFQKRKYSFSGVKSMEYMFSVEDLWFCAILWHLLGRNKLFFLLLSAMQVGFSESNASNRGYIWCWYSSVTWITWVYVHGISNENPSIPGKRLSCA